MTPFGTLRMHAGVDVGPLSAVRYRALTGHDPAPRRRSWSGSTAATGRSLLPTTPTCSSPGRAGRETYRPAGQVDLALGLTRERFGGGLAQVVELVRQGSLFTSSNGERSLETNT